MNALLATAHHSHDLPAHTKRIQLRTTLRCELVSPAPGVVEPLTKPQTNGLTARTGHLFEVPPWNAQVAFARGSAGPPRDGWPTGRLASSGPAAAHRRPQAPSPGRCRAATAVRASACPSRSAAQSSRRRGLRRARSPRPTSRQDAGGAQVLQGEVKAALPVDPPPWTPGRVDRVQRLHSALSQLPSRGGARFPGGAQLGVLTRLTGCCALILQPHHSAIPSPPHAAFVGGTRCPCTAA